MAANEDVVAGADGSETIEGGRAMVDVLRDPDIPLADAPLAMLELRETHDVPEENIAYVFDVLHEELAEHEGRDTQTAAVVSGMWDGLTLAERARFLQKRQRVRDAAWRVDTDDERGATHDAEPGNYGGNGHGRGFRRTGNEVNRLTRSRDRGDRD